MDDAVAQHEQRFVWSSPTALVATHEGYVVWPVSGNPIVLDHAGMALYDCFQAPLSIADLASDLVDAVGLTAVQATTTVFGLVSGLVQSGHLIGEGLNPMPVSLLSYPPTASP